MDDAQQDQYEERLKEVFDSFDASGLGSLCPEELSELCLSLHLEEATPALLHTLLQNQDRLTGRVDFDQFKNALILVLSTTTAAPSPSQDTCAPPDSPEVHPKFVRGSKRYGRRSTPEFIPDFSEAISIEATEDPEENDDSTVPRKRERWNAQETNTEEYEAEGQLHLWNPDEPTTPRGSIAPLSDRLEERLRCACEELAVPWDGCASYHELLALCEHLGLEVTEDELQCLGGDGVMSVQEFLTRVLNHSKPPTPSASTPYRQLKRHHSTQPFDETGRRIATASVMTGTIGMRLFSTLDDGTGYIPVEYILDAWLEEGIENSPEILQALDFSLDGKVNLTELTLALENELLITKNGIHQAALASFKAEIRHQLECVDRELREKEKIRSDLEKAEKIKTQLATEVDEHHSAIERMNDLNLRKLEQDHKEKLAAVKSELIKEMDLMQLQAGLQREELEAEMEKIRDDETFLRDHLSITIKENRRLEIELFDSTEKLGEAESQVSKLQKNLDNVLKEKFGDMDPGCAEFFLQEERLRQLRSSYEEQCRALQDRIDELQAELQEFHSLGRAPQLGLKPFLSEEFESKSPGMESDPGIGSEEGQPFNMSLEAEMMLEQLKEQHLREMESLRAQLESKVSEFDEKVEEQRTAHDEHKAALSLQYLKEIQSLRQEMSSVQNQAQELQSQLEQAELERANVEQRQAGEREDLESQQEEEISNLRQELLETHTHVADIEEQLKALETQRAEAELGVDTKMEELRRLHAEELNRLDGEHIELLKVRLEDERGKLQWERAEIERKLLEGWESEKVQLQQRHEEALKARIEEMSVRFQAEREEHEMRLTEEWEKERAQLDEQGNESLQVVLEEEMLRLVKQQEERESRLIEQWEVERAQLQDYQEVALFAKIADESERLQQQHELREKKLEEEWEKERLQLEEDYEGMLQDRLSEEREKLQEEKELLEKRLGQLMEEEKTRLEERHREAMHELSAKHTEEREKLSGLLDKLREDIAEERKELENHFSQKIKEVEARFSGDQDAVSKRFETDVSNLEQHYQSQLKALSDSHAEQKIKWEAEIEKAHQEAEEQRTILKKAMALEQEHLNQELVKEQDQMESIHKEKIDDLMAKNQELQVELDSFIRIAQTKEIELSRQLNDLHNRFQENLDTKDELLAQSEKKVLEIELLLNQAVEDFKQERAELQGSLDELETKHTEVLSMAEKKFEERGKLLSECDDLRLKIQELEILLSQAVDDFELERQELQENTLELEVRLKEKLSSSELQESERAENEKVGLMAERHQLCITIQEMGVELNQLVESTDTAEDKEMKELNEINSPLEEEDLKAKTLTSSPEEQEPFSEHIKVSGEICDNETIPIPEDWGFLDVQSENNIITEACDQEVTVSDGLNDIVVEYATSAEQGQDDEVEMITESPDGMEGCPDNTITIHEVVGDEAIVDDSHVPVVEIEGQDDNASEGGTESPEDIEVCHANIIISVELCDDDVCTIPEEEEFQIAEDQEEAEDNFDEYSNDNVIEYLFPEYEPQTDDVDEDKEMSCDSSVLEHSSPEVEEIDGDSDVDEFGLDKNVMYESFALEDNPQDVDADEDEGSSPHKEVQSHVTVIDPSSPEERNDTDCLQEKTQDLESEIELIPQLQQECDEVDVCEIINLGQVQVQGQASCLAELQDQCDTATEENMLLQQKITILESLLAVNNEKRAAGQQALEDNCKLKAKMLAIMEQATEMEMKASELTDLQIRYEECICENAKLGEQNYKLEKRVMGFESKMHIIQDFQDQQVALVDEIARMREENCKLTALVSELERQDELLLALQQEAESTEATPEESFLDLSSQLEEKIQAVSDLEDCCTEFEKQNGMLRKALTDLQDNSLRIHERMQAHRNESGRLAGENLVLRHKISSLKEEELKETQEEMLLKLEYFRKEKIAAQKMAESFKKQVSDLRRRSQQLEEENGLLSQKNAENAANVEGLSQQLNELLRQSEREEAVRDAGPVSADKKTGLAACVSALEAELTMALEASVLLEEEKAQLMQQLSAHREKVAKMGAIESQFTHLLQERQSADKLTQGLRTQLSTAQDRIQTLNETLQAVNLQSARLKSDLRVSQQEKDALKQDVISLHKQLQNANDKNQVLEMALHSSGFQSQHKKLYRDELARLVEQEQQMLRQENERLQLEVHNTKGDLIHTREKTRQLEATILSLKQQKQQVQSSLVKALEQDNASLKRELDTLHKERLSTKNMACEDGEGQRELESLRQENEGLKAHQTRLQTQLLEALQAQLGGLLPVSPHRLPGERRGQHRGDDPENVQDDREMQMMNMEGRMREIELSLHNVKLLLKEKVSQLKDQLHRNGKADVLIKDLYVENAQLLKALEMTEQRQKVAEKKNYLLEEKISSLNKIVRDLSPSPLPTVPYHFTCS